MPGMVVLLGVALLKPVATIGGLSWTFAAAAAIGALFWACDALIWAYWALPQLVDNSERVKQMMQADGYRWTWWAGWVKSAETGAWEDDRSDARL